MNVRPLLVLDEPTVGLDPLTRAALWNAFRSAPRRPPLRLLGRLRLHDAIQAAILCAVGYGFLGVMTSAFARSEFRAVQFMPIVIVSQVFLCGLLVPVDRLPVILEWIVNILPLTYSVEAVGIIGSQVGGLIMARYIVGIEPVTALSDDEVIAIYGPILQHLIDMPLNSGRRPPCRYRRNRGSNGRPRREC